MDAADVEALHLELERVYDGADREQLEADFARIRGMIPEEAHRPVHQARFDAGEYETLRAAGEQKGGLGFHMDDELLQQNLPIVTLTYMMPDGLVARTRIEPHEVVGHEENVHRLVWMVERLRSTR